jgi:hypothetical protein
MRLPAKWTIRQIDVHWMSRSNGRPNQASGWHKARAMPQTAADHKRAQEESKLVRCSARSPARFSHPRAPRCPRLPRGSSAARRRAADYSLPRVQQHGTIRQERWRIVDSPRRELRGSVGRCQKGSTSLRKPHPQILASNWASQALDSH